LEEEGKGKEVSSPTGEPMLRVVVGQWGHDPSLALGTLRCELLST